MWGPPPDCVAQLWTILFSEHQTLFSGPTDFHGTIFTWLPRKVHHAGYEPTCCGWTILAWRAHNQFLVPTLLWLGVVTNPTFGALLMTWRLQIFPLGPVLSRCIGIRMGINDGSWRRDRCHWHFKSHGFITWFMRMGGEGIRQPHLAHSEVCLTSTGWRLLPAFLKIESSRWLLFSDLSGGAQEV